MVTLLIGRGGAGKSDAIFRRMTREAPRRRQVLIVPEQYSHLAERRLCAQGNRLALGCEVLTFTRLASRVFGAAGGLATPTLDGGGRLLVMYLAVQRMASGLTVYAKPSRKPSFLTGLLETLDECKSYQVTPRGLGEAGGRLGGALGEKMGDLSRIFVAYELLCDQLGADPRDRLTRLAAALRESRWCEGIDLYIDGFTDFTPQEGLVLSALMEQANSLTVALTCDHLTEDEDGLGIFSPARRTGAFVTRLAQKAGKTVKEETLTGRNGEKDPALAWLEQQLFADHPDPWPAAPPVALCQGEDPRQEVEWTAARVLELVREGGYRFRDIAVTARSFEGYEELVDELFPRYGIPVFLSRSQDILEKPVLALITGALEAVNGGYRYEDMFRYLKTGLAGISDGERDRLENYVLAWDLRGSRWTAQAPWHFHPRGFAETWTDADEAACAQLDGLRRRVIAPLERLRRAPGTTGRDRAMALYDFLEDIRLPQTLADRVNALRERGEPTLAQEYGQLWDILVTALEQAGALLAEEEMSLEEFSRLFALTLSQYEVSAIPVALDRVTAGECTRLGYQHYRAVFFLGCDDQRVPQCTPAPGLFTDDDREALAREGLTLAPRRWDKLHREMTIVYNACTLPTQALYVTWPAKAGGEERRPAFLIPRLERVFPQLRRSRVSEGADPRLAAAEPALEAAAALPGVREALRTVPGFDVRLDRLDAALSQRRGSLSRAGVEAVFGRQVRMSSSQLDLCRSCHFAHFMRYGLNAEPRRRSDFDALEYGKFVHAVLEEVVKLWDPSLDEAATRALAREAMDRYLRETLGGMEDKTARFAFLFRRLSDMVERVVCNVTDELRRSDFRPLAFELGFGKGEDKAMPPVELRAGDVTLTLTGFIDRVDGWVKDGKLYLRVMDYKTGKKPFDLGDILNGIGLQMLLYLSTLEREGEDYFGRPVEAAGVLYIPAREAVVAGSRDMDEAQRQAQTDKLLRREGLVLRDPAVIEAMEHFTGKCRFLDLRVNKDGVAVGDALASAEQLGQLARHVDRVLRAAARELGAGRVDADPYYRTPDHNACLWCPYRSACQFEEGAGGESRRRRRGVKAKEFWEALEGGDEDGL